MKTKLIVSLLLACACVFGQTCQTGQTQIVDTLNNLDGSAPAQGYAIISSLPFTTVAGVAVPGTPVMRTITNGAVNFCLYPNIGGSPAVSYSVRYTLDSPSGLTNTYTETWNVPVSSLPCTINPISGGNCYVKSTSAQIFAPGQLDTTGSSSGQVVCNVGGVSKWCNASSAGSPLSAKGQLYGFSTTGAALSPGADGTLLFANSSQALGLQWKSPILSDVAAWLGYTPVNPASLGTAAYQPTSAFDAAGAAAAAQAASVQKSANLSDLANAATARTNLGISTVGHTGAYSDLTGVPTFGTLAPSASVLGTVMYWNGSAWVVLSGNNSGTACLQENSSGTPVWGACGSGGGSPGGGGTAIQVNGGGLFIGDQANFSYNSTTHAMTATGSIYMGPNTPSTILGGFYGVQNITGDSIFYDVFHDESVFNVTTTGGFTSFDSDLLINGATNYNHSNAFQDRRRYAGTGSIGTVNGFYHQIVLSGGGAVNNLYPVHLAAPTLTNGSTVGNWAAVQIDSAPTVTGSAYNIYAAPNIPSYFGGPVQLANGGSLGTGTFTGAATFSGNLTFSGVPTFTSTAAPYLFEGLSIFGGATSNPNNATVLVASTSGSVSSFLEIDGNSVQGTNDYIKAYNPSAQKIFHLNYNGGTIAELIDPVNSSTLRLETGNGFGEILNTSNNALIFGTNNAENMRMNTSGNLSVGLTSSIGRVGVKTSDSAGGTSAYIAQNSGGATIFGVGSGGAITSAVNAVTFSATPSFNLALGDYQTITLTGNVTSSTLASVKAGQTVTFHICQDATGGRTFAWPAVVHNAMTVTSAANGCSDQVLWSPDGTNLYAGLPPTSGTGSVMATTTGAQTANALVSIDANGNHVANPATSDTSGNIVSPASISGVNLNAAGALTSNWPSPPSRNYLVNSTSTGFDITKLANNGGGWPLAPALFGAFVPATATAGFGTPAILAGCQTAADFTYTGGPPPVYTGGACAGARVEVGMKGPFAHGGGAWGATFLNGNCDTNPSNSSPNCYPASWNENIEADMWNVGAPSTASLSGTIRNLHLTFAGTACGTACEAIGIQSLSGTWNSYSLVPLTYGINIYAGAAKAGIIIGPTLIANSQPSAGAYQFGFDSYGNIQQAQWLTDANGGNNMVGANNTGIATMSYGSVGTGTFPANGTCTVGAPFTGGGTGNGFNGTLTITSGTPASTITVNNPGTSFTSAVTTATLSGSGCSGVINVGSSLVQPARPMFYCQNAANGIKSCLADNAGGMESTGRFYDNRTFAVTSPSSNGTWTAAQWLGHIDTTPTTAVTFTTPTAAQILSAMTGSGLPGTVLQHYDTTINNRAGSAPVTVLPGSGVTFSGASSFTIPPGGDAVVENFVSNVGTPAISASVRSAITPPNYITPLTGTCASDGSADCTAAIESTCLAAGTQTCYFPPGYYSVNNSAGGVTITGFQGKIIMDPMACIIPTAANQPLFKFVASSNNAVLVDNFCVKYQSQATTRLGINVEFSGYTDLRVRGFYSLYGPGASIWFSNGTRNILEDSTIIGSGGPGNGANGADGAHFASCQDSGAINVRAFDTGDDCFAWTNAKNYQNATGGIGTQLYCVASSGNGVRVEGQPRIQLSNIHVDSTAGDGIVVNTGVLASGTAQQWNSPSEILIDGFEVTNAGTYNTKSNALGYGLHVYGPGAGSVTFANGIVSKSRSNGFGTDADSYKTILRNVDLIGNGGACLNALGTNVTVQNVRCERNAGKGAVLNATGNVQVNSLVSQDDNYDSRIGSPHRAVELTGSGSHISGSGLTIIDSNGYLDPDTVAITAGGTGYSDTAATTITVTGCTVAPTVKAWTNGSGVLSVIKVESLGSGCSGSPGWTVGGSGTSATISGYFSGALQGVDMAVTGGSSYTVAPTAAVTVTAGICYGFQPQISTGLSSGAVTGSWLVPATKCVSGTTFNVVLSGGSGGSGASISLSLHGAPTLPTNNILYESGVAAGSSLADPKFQLATGSPSVTVDANFALNVPNVCNSALCTTQQVSDLSGNPAAQIMTTLQLSEGSAPSGVSAFDLIYGLSGSHRPAVNPNNAGQILLGGIASAGTSGHCLQLAANGIDYTDSGAACGGGGGSVNVNGSSVSSPNFNGATPAATSGNQNVAFQVSGSNVSAQVPTPAYTGALNAIGSGGSAQTIALTAGAIQTITLSANLTVSFTQPSGTTGIVRLGITQAASGGPYTVAWSGAKWPGGIVPVMSSGASQIDWYSCLLDGTTAWCTAGQNFQ